MGKHKQLLHVSIEYKPLLTHAAAGRSVGPLVVNRLYEHATLFWSFPYVCPEPVLVK
jgi:uncharacterized membrane protein YsdA (DUF1294 family)